MNPTNPLSACCQDYMTTQGGIEGTNYYTCNKCHEPCDQYVATNPNEAKYAGIYTDENLIATQFCDSEENAWQELVDNSGETRESLKSAHYVQRFTQKEIDDLPEVDV